MRIHYLFSRTLCVKVTCLAGVSFPMVNPIPNAIIIWDYPTIEDSVSFLLCQFILTGTIYHWFMLFSIESGKFM